MFFTMHKHDLGNKYMQGPNMILKNLFLQVGIPKEDKILPGMMGLSLVSHHGKLNDMYTIDTDVFIIS